MDRPRARPGRRWLSRLVAGLCGVGLLIGNINFAADLGDILLAVPGLVLGGLQLLYACTNQLPRWSGFALASAGGLFVSGINFVGDLWAPVFVRPMLMLGGLQLLSATLNHFRPRSGFARGTA